ncbi:unnamed protein product [Discula destructiva]
MAPPPLTPAQPRFLLPKSQKPKSANPLQSGPQQFASTPRFNVSRTTPHQSAASHQPPFFSTPVQPSAKLRATQYEPSSDSIDTSPISSDLPREVERGPTLLDESIELESQSPSASKEDGERPTKRRRLSMSPVVDVTPDEEDPPERVTLDDDRMVIDNTPLSNDDDNDGVPNRAEHPMADAEIPPPIVSVPIRHPTFLSAPRFKTSEAVEANQSNPPLPDAFSPQRRGVKYVPGGLAAEVRDWLVQVKGPSEYDRPAGQSVRLNVKQVRTCNPSGMCIISGTEVKGGADIDGSLVQKDVQEHQPAKVILAGDGRIVGLGGKRVVARGKTLSLYQPMWDIALDDLGRFAVACDWDD